MAFQLHNNLIHYQMYQAVAKQQNVRSNVWKHQSHFMVLLQQCVWNCSSLDQYSRLYLMSCASWVGN